MENDLVKKNNMNLLIEARQNPYKFYEKYTFHEIAVKFHPDRNSSNLVIFQEFKTLYEVLKDLRKYYVYILMDFPDILSRKIGGYDTLIFEGAQGMLLNQDQPDGTWSDVTPRNAVQLCKSMGIPWEVMGVTRTYLTRHGGRLEERFRNFQFQSDHNVPNYQGTMEFGPWNRGLLSKSVKRAQIDSIAINHLDGNHDIWISHPVFDLNIQCSVVGRGPTYRDKTIYTH